MLRFQQKSHQKAGQHNFVVGLCAWILRNADHPVWHSPTLTFLVFLDLTSYLVFIPKIKSSAYPHAPPWRGSQTIMNSFFQIDVPISARIGVPQKVGQFNYVCMRLSPPFRTSHLIVVLDAHLYFHCVSLAFQEGQGLHRLTALTRYPIMPLAWEKEPFTSSQCQNLTFLNFNYTK